MGADASDSHFYVPSKLNRADAPRRDAEVPPPDVPRPVWSDQLLQDDCSGFDAWIASLPSPDGNSVPDFQQLIKPLHVRIKRCSVALEFQKSAKQLRHGDVISASKSRRTVKAVRHERVTSATKPLDESVVSSFSPDVVNKLNKFSAGIFYKPEGNRGFFKAGALDLYSGKAGVAKRLIDEGAPWVLSVDILNGASQNLLDLSLQQRILRLIGMGAFKVVGSATIWQSFTRAITPCVRTKKFLRGVAWMSRNMQQKVSDGNKHYDFNKQVIDECEASSTFYWFENPDSSFVWQQVGFERYKSPKSNHQF